MKNTEDENKKDNKIVWYGLRAFLLLAYVGIGLFLWLWLLLWNHGLFGAGAEMIPTWVEFIGFIVWILVGIKALILICKKKLKSIIKTILVAIGMVVLFMLAIYTKDEIIPNLKMINKVKNVKGNAETVYEVSTTQSTALNTLFLDLDNKTLSYWIHRKEYSAKYDSLRTFEVTETDITFDELPIEDIMYKLPYKDGEIYCLSEQNHYNEIKSIYWFYNGKMYFANVSDMFWYGDLEEFWREYN